MRVFLYEAITGGGWFQMGSAEPLSASLLCEGRAMACAVRDDLLRIPGCRVETLADARASVHGHPWWREGLADPSANVVGHDVADLAEHDARFDRAVRESTAVILVAPEIGGMLAHLAGRVEELGGNLRGSSRDFTLLASDKSRLAAEFTAAGVPTPATWRLDARTVDLLDWDSLLAAGHSWILKPNDGAGSLDIQQVTGARLKKTVERAIAGAPQQAWCLQEYRPGRAASVAAIVDGPHWLLLPPCWQMLDGETFAYRGGAVIEETTWVRRAWKLAERALSAMPLTRGYVGMDLVLAEDGDERKDALIEVNPRLTTSYVGLRHAISLNLARVMLEGWDATSPSYCGYQRRVQFDSQGAVTFADGGGGDGVGGDGANDAEEAGA